MRGRRVVRGEERSEGGGGIQMVKETDKRQRCRRELKEEKKVIIYIFTQDNQTFNFIRILSSKKATLDAKKSHTAPRSPPPPCSYVTVCKAFHFVHHPASPTAVSSICERCYALKEVAYGTKCWSKIKYIVNSGHHI